MSQFSRDVAAAARKSGLAIGATAGASAGGAVISGVSSAAGSTAMAVALGANPVVLAGALVVGLSYAGWWVAKKVTDPLDRD